jgi:hypothetical protein
MKNVIQVLSTWLTFERVFVTALVIFSIEVGFLLYSMSQSQPVVASLILLLVATVLTVLVGVAIWCCVTVFEDFPDTRGPSD